MIEVELLINSGLQNPRWTLTEEEENSLVEQITATPSLLSSTLDNHSHLGFAGFILRLVSPDGRWASLVQQQRLPPFCVINVGRNQDLIIFLVQTSVKPNVDVNDYLRDLLVIPYAPELLLPKRPSGTEYPGSPPLCCASTFLSGNDLAYWTESSNNCYCYASNKKIGHFGTPGSIGRRSLKLPLDGTDVAEALKADGWKLSCDPKNNLNIALTIMPPNRDRTAGDFHFYRLISTTPYTYGNKHGAYPAETVDFSRHTITNPETCDRRIQFPSGVIYDYSIFCGYFFRDNSGFTIS